MQNKPPAPEKVDLSASAERRFAAAAAEVGGRQADIDLVALHTLMCSTVELLAEIDTAILPPIYQDHASRA